MEQSSAAMNSHQKEDGVFKNLLFKLSLNMDEKEAESLLFLAECKLPKNVDNKQLGALSRLNECGVISPRSCAKLHKYYEDMQRNDLANLVLRYMQENHDMAAKGRSMHAPVDEEIPEEECSLHTAREQSAQHSLSDTSHIIAPVHHSSEDDGANCELSTATAEPTREDSPHRQTIVTKKFGSEPDVHRESLSFAAGFSGNSNYLGSQEILLNQGNSVSFQSLPSQSSPNSQVAPGTEISISVGDVDIRVKTPNSSSSVSPPPLQHTDTVGVTPNKATALRRGGRKASGTIAALRYSTLHETPTPDEHSEGHESQGQREVSRDEQNEEKQADIGEEKRRVEEKEVTGVGGQGERREWKEKQEHTQGAPLADDHDTTSKYSTLTLSTKTLPPPVTQRELIEGSYTAYTMCNTLYCEKFIFLQSLQEKGKS